MDIREIADKGLDTIPGLIEDLKSMVHDDANFSPKQRVDAGKALTSLLQLVLDRTHPRLTSSQQTTFNVDAAKVLAKILPPGQARQLADQLGKQLLPAPEKVIDAES